jgi:hypothetical protein
MLADAGRRDTSKLRVDAEARGISLKPRGDLFALAYIKRRRFDVDDLANRSEDRCLPPAEKIQD